MTEIRIKSSAMLTNFLNLKRANPHLRVANGAEFYGVEKTNDSGPFQYHSGALMTE